MNLERLLLDTLRDIRKIHRPSFSSFEENNPFALKYRPLRSLAIKLHAKSVVIYFFPKSKNKRAKRLMIYGPLSDWKWLPEELEELSDNNSANSSKILLPIECPPRTVYKVSFPIGYIGFKKNDNFTNKEIEILLDTVNFYGDYVFENMRVRSAFDAHRAFRRIFNYDTLKRKAGTSVANFHGKLHRAMSAWASYFAVCDENLIFIEYHQSPHRHRPRYIENVNIETLPLSLNKQMNESDRFFWMDKNADTQLYSILKQYDTNKDDEWVYYFLVYKNEGIPIATSIFQFRKGELIFLEEFDDLVSLIQHKMYIPVKYLYQRRTKKMIVEPIYKYRDTRINERFAFVLMPFCESWSSRIWEKILKPLLEKEGLNAKRADDLYGRDIMEDVWKNIVSSRIVIADITSRNANVFYELGLAHAIGKPVILLTQDVDDIPFDLNRYRHIVYEDNFDGYESLGNQLTNTIQDILNTDFRKV